MCGWVGPVEGRSTPSVALPHLWQRQCPFLALGAGAELHATGLAATSCFLCSDSAFIPRITRGRAAENFHHPTTLHETAMLYKITLAAAVAGLAFAQDDTPSSIDLSTIPTVTITDNIVTGSAPSTSDVVTATGVACIPESDMVFSIQTDTSIRTGPLTVTPLCGQSVTPTGVETGSMSTQGVITGGVGGNATALNNSTVSLTTTLAGTETGLTTISATDSETTNSEAQSGTDSSAPAATQTDSPAGKVAVGAAAGLLGLAAGVVML
ncbi:hypothetical protein BST61_g2075 [Cercospora zeina]